MNYIIQIEGNERYDVPNCVVNSTYIDKWNKIKEKISLTPEEIKEFYKILKNNFHCNVYEKQTKSGNKLFFSKSVKSIDFNNLLRQFVNKYKICTYCNKPEIINGVCQSCGK